MKRLCFLSPDLEHAKTVIQDLKDNDIKEKHIYTIAKSGTPLGDLPDGVQTMMIFYLHLSAVWH